MTVKNLADIIPNESSVSLFGGKAVNLSKMIAMGLPVPPGFVTPTSWTEPIGGVKGFTTDDKALRHYVTSAIREVSTLEHGTWNKDDSLPLVVSVRSGAPVSMPGMMDTILNIGLTSKNLEAFADHYNRKFALDCYRRLISMYGTTVHGIDENEFSDLWGAFNVFYYDGLSESSLEDLIERYQAIYENVTGDEFPDDPEIQLTEAVRAVYRSWYSERAISYREIEGLDHDMGTAVTVQKMVFGNLGEDSATGVVFTHDPNTGALGLYGDFLEGAQGEDVVSGAFKVKPISAMMKSPVYGSLGRELQGHLRNLYMREKDILDIEFTIENGKLWLLQYRTAKRSSKASVRFIIDSVKRADMSVSEASDRLIGLLPKKNVSLADHENLDFIGKGIGVTSELAIGKAAITKDFVKECIDNDEPYILLANETSPSDTPKMKDAAGILTAQGGTISHAAIIARGWDKPCVVSASNMKVLEDSFSISDTEYPEGTLIKIDGDSGCIWI